jgi:hypothetical protein
VEKRREIITSSATECVGFKLDGGIVSRQSSKNFEIRRGRKKGRFTPSGGRGNLGAARVGDDGTVAALARRRNSAAPVTKLRPSN